MIGKNLIESTDNRSRADSAAILASSKIPLSASSTANNVFGMLGSALDKSTTSSPRRTPSFGKPSDSKVTNRIVPPFIIVSRYNL